MPESLEVDDGTITHDALALGLFSNLPQFAHAKQVLEEKLGYRDKKMAELCWNRRDESLLTTDEKHRAEAMGAVDVYASNLERYGHLTWYDWSLEHWGTKWNAYESRRHERFITFMTAWSAPLPIFEKLVEMFSDVPMDIYWYEEQGIEYVGEMLSDGKGNVWLYEGARDKVAAAVYAKCNDGEDIRFHDGMLITEDEFYGDEEYFVEELACPPFEEMSEVPEFEDIAQTFGKRVGLSFSG